MRRRIRPPCAGVRARSGRTRAAAVPGPCARGSVEVGSLVARRVISPCTSASWIASTMPAVTSTGATTAPATAAELTAAPRRCESRDAARGPQRVPAEHECTACIRSHLQVRILVATLRLFHSPFASSCAIAFDPCRLPSESTTATCRIAMCPGDSFLIVQQVLIPARIRRPRPGAAADDDGVERDREAFVRGAGDRPRLLQRDRLVELPVAGAGREHREHEQGGTNG